MRLKRVSFRVKHFRTSIACLAVGFSLCAAAAIRPPRAPDLKVVTSGSVEALALGGTTLSRPFGALLIDHLRVVGSYDSPTDHYYLVEGTAGATCPARYLIVAARPGRPPSVSAPFGTCGIGATVRPDARGLVISVAPGPTDREPLRYFYGRGGLRRLDVARETTFTAGAAITQCPAESAVEAILPAEYRTRAGVRHADIPPDQLRGMLAGLACAAADKDRASSVEEVATPLFLSKRYGETAFAMLDELGTARGSDPQLRAFAQAFAAAMHYQVARYEPL